MKHLGLYIGAALGGLLWHDNARKRASRWNAIAGPMQRELERTGGNPNLIPNMLAADIMIQDVKSIFGEKRQELPS